MHAFKSTTRLSAQVMRTLQAKRFTRSSEFHIKDEINLNFVCKNNNGSEMHSNPPNLVRNVRTFFPQGDKPLTQKVVLHISFIPSAWNRNSEKSIEDVSISRTSILLIYQ